MARRARTMAAIAAILVAVMAAGALAACDYVGDAQWQLPARTRMTIRPMRDSNECLTVLPGLSAVILQSTPCVDAANDAQCFHLVSRGHRRAAISPCDTGSALTPATTRITGRITNRAQVSVADSLDVPEQAWEVENIYPTAVDSGLTRPLADAFSLVEPQARRSSRRKRLPARSFSNETTARRPPAWIVRFSNQRRLVPPLAPVGQHVPVLNQYPAFRTFNAYLCWTVLTLFEPLSVRYITKICKGEPRPNKISHERPRKTLWNSNAQEQDRHRGRSLWLLVPQ